ncbi:hypothetical protein WA026_014255 [Henosepilachna vigintioctopunctata]|uniref:Uncharacterized protein n=1 Tax=Henosepilachna vigintioctopunctata TaxID=420089 RepID=A0AAW1TT54_9CUCU
MVGEGDLLVGVLIRDATRVTDRTSTLLDVVFTNKEFLIIESGTVDNMLLDHQAVFRYVNLSRPKDKPKIVTYHNFNHLCIPDLEADLAGVPWDDILYLHDIDLKIEVFSRYLLQVFDVRALYSTCSLRREKKAFLGLQFEGGSKNLWKALNLLNVRGESGFEVPQTLRDPDEINRHFSSVFAP